VTTFTGRNNSVPISISKKNNSKVRSKYAAAASADLRQQFGSIKESDVGGHTMKTSVAMTEIKQKSMHRSKAGNAHSDLLDQPELEPEDPKLKYGKYMEKVSGAVNFEKQRSKRSLL